VNRAESIYTDDVVLIAFAALNDIPCVRVEDLAIPDSARQGELPFQAGDDNHEGAP